MKSFLCVAIACLGLFELKCQENIRSIEYLFDQLKVTGNIHLVLVASDTQQVILESAENQEALSVESTDNQLILKNKSELNKEPAIKVKLQYISLSRLELTKGARVQSADTLMASILILKAATGAQVKVNATEILDANATSKGSVGGEINELTE